MKCQVCYRNDAVCEIRGLRVCADNFCKYEAWTVKEADGDSPKEDGEEEQHDEEKDVT